MIYRPLSHIEYDTEFRNAITSMLNEFVKIEENTLESQLILIDYNVMRMKERARLLLKEYMKRVEQTREKDNSSLTS